MTIGDLLKVNLLQVFPNFTDKLQALQSESIESYSIHLSFPKTSKDKKIQKTN